MSTHMRPVLLSALAATLTASALIQAESPGLASATADDAEWNHFTTEARLVFNVRARFQNVGGFGVVPPPPPSNGGAVDRTYGDGFVQVDSSGNQGGLTWNWGYRNSSQIPGNDTIQFHASSVSGVTTSRRDDPSLGFEFSYVRDFGHEDWGSWGLKTGFGYNNFRLEDRQLHLADVSRLTDTYALSGVQVPLAPYAGSAQGPGVSIGSTPTRSIQTVQGGAQILGGRTVDADLYQFHLGPNVDLRLSDKVSLEVGGGLALGIVDSSLSYAETLITSDSTRLLYGSHQDSGILPGVYFEAELRYRFWRSASVFGGVGFQYLGTFNQSAGPRSVQLDFSETLIGLAGLSWSF